MRNLVLKLQFCFLKTAFLGTFKTQASPLLCSHFPRLFVKICELLPILPWLVWNVHLFLCSSNIKMYFYSILSQLCPTFFLRINYFSHLFKCKGKGGGRDGCLLGSCAGWMFRPLLPLHQQPALREMVKV